MKKFILIIFLGIWGGNLTIQAQILSKIKTAAKKVANEVSNEIISEIECAVFDQECIEKAKKEGKKVVLVEDKNPGEESQNQSPSDDQYSTNEKSSTPSGDLSDFYKKRSTMAVCQISRPNTEFFTNEDLSIMAVPVFNGSRRAYCINGNIESSYDILETFFFSPDGKHYAYSAYKEDICYLILDGKVIDQTPGQRKFVKISWNNNSSIMAYIKILEKSKGQVIINGKESAILESINMIPFFINGDKAYYATVIDGKTNLFSNHKPINHKDITDLTWNQTAGVFLYKIANGTSGEKLVINGKETPEYKNISRYNIDPGTGAVNYEADGREVVFWKDKRYELPKDERLQYNTDNCFLANEKSSRLVFLTKNDFYRVYDNGKSGPPYQYVQNLQLSEDGETLFYSAYNAGKAFLIRNGQEIGPYQSLREIYVSPSGKDYFYIAETTPGQLTHFQNGKNLNIPSIYDLFLSPDLSRYLIAANREYYIDGENYEGKLNVITPPLFSPNGERLAYVLEDKSSGHSEALVLDGKEYPGEASISSFRSFVFSEDSKHFAFAQLTSERNYRLYIDMKPGPVLGSIPTLKFSNPDILRVITTDSEKISKYEIALN